MPIAAIALAAALQAAPARRCDPDAMQTAALHEIYPDFGIRPSDLAAWLGDWSAASLQDYRRRIARLRVRAAGVADPCARAAYLGWADFYEDGVRDAESELRDHHVRRRQDEYNARLRRHQAAARAQHIERLPR